MFHHYNHQIHSIVRPILNILNYHCCCIVTWHLLAANSKLVEILNQAASTRCSGDDKEQLSTSIHSEYVSDFWHDRKSALEGKQQAWWRMLEPRVSSLKFTNFTTKMVI